MRSPEELAEGHRGVASEAGVFAELRTSRRGAGEPTEEARELARRGEGGTTFVSDVADETRVGIVERRNS